MLLKRYVVDRGICTTDIDIAEIFRSAGAYAMPRSCIFSFLHLLIFRNLYAFCLCLAFGMILFPWRAQRLCVELLLQLSHEAVDSFLDQMMPEQDWRAGSASQNKGWVQEMDAIDWENLATQHYTLDLHLQNLWASGEASVLFGLELQLDGRVGTFCWVFLS